MRDQMPDGFSWGQGNGGAAQLAIALLLELTTEEIALLWYPKVQWHIIARLPQDDFAIDSQEILDCIVAEVEEERKGEEAPRAVGPTVIEVEYRYTREELKALFDQAYSEDVEKGGRYDARSGAIQVYTHPWHNETMREESTLIGTFYTVWGQGNQIWQVEIHGGFVLDDLLEDLGALEEKALGAKIHGR